MHDILRTTTTGIRCNFNLGMIIYFNYKVLLSYCDVLWLINCSFLLFVSAISWAAMGAIPVMWQASFSNTFYLGRSLASDEGEVTGRPHILPTNFIRNVDSWKLCTISDRLPSSDLCAYFVSYISQVPSVVWSVVSARATSATADS